MNRFHLVTALLLLASAFISGCEFPIGEEESLQTEQGTFENLRIDRDFNFNTTQTLDLQEVAAQFNPNYNYQVISFDEKRSNFGVVSGKTLVETNSFNAPISISGLRFNPVGKGAGSATILIGKSKKGKPGKVDDDDDDDDEDEDEDEEQGDKDPNTCAIEKDNGGGFETAISSVVDNGNDFTIILTVVHDGCSGKDCEELEEYKVKTKSGSSSVSFSNITVQGDIGVDETDIKSKDFKIKVDKNNTIGDGTAGSFTVTFTINSLQELETEAKAKGPNKVSFTKEEFESVEENCGVISSDSDNDGIDDNNDEFPNDPNRASITYAPAGQGQQGTLLFEDLWPVTGDYDFNDLVVDYELQVISNAQSNVKELKFDLELKAVGGIFQKGFAVSLPVASSNIQSVSGQEISPGGVFDVNQNGVEDFGSTSVIPFFDDAHALLPPAPGDQVTNAKPSSPTVSPVDLQVSIVFQNPIAPGLVNNHPLDYFIVPKNDRSIEIHLKGKPNVDPSVAQHFGTEEDRSDPGDNEFYQTASGLPWALHVAEEIPHPEENQDFADAYPLFTSWAQSDGNENRDWFEDKPGNRNESLLFFVVPIE